METHVEERRKTDIVVMDDLLKNLLTTTITQKASDLHISPDEPAVIRMDGELVRINESAPLTAETTKKILYSILNRRQQSELESKREMDLAIAIENVSRFRVNIFHQIKGLAAAFRPIPEAVPTLDSLKLPEIFKRLVNLPNGLILVTGPTGSGKSTTLAAMVDHINKNQACHILTVEDPIEFTYHCDKSLINQREVHRDTLDFSIALRSALREDPDVILVGEMRDLETMRLALTAAETGHLVMSTLHTSSAPRTINRIVDVFPAGEKNMIRNMLSESIQAVITQTLIKCTNGGRVPAFEIMLGTSAIRNLIREDKIAQMYSTIQTSSESGMCTLDQYVQSLLAKNLITAAAARDVIVHKSKM